MMFGIVCRVATPTINAHLEAANGTQNPQILRTTNPTKEEAMSSKIDELKRAHEAELQEKAGNFVGSMGGLFSKAFKTLAGRQNEKLQRGLEEGTSSRAERQGLPSKNVVDCGSITLALDRSTR